MGNLTERLLYHERLVLRIGRAERLVTILALADDIKSTVITEGHDKIESAWKTQCKHLSLDEDLNGVLTDLRLQKKEAEEQAVSRASRAFMGRELDIP